MIKLENIKAEFEREGLSLRKKLIRVSIQSIARTSRRTAKIISERSIQWDQPIIIPLQYNEQILFEIYNKHEFGYNPEEFSEIFKGKFTIGMKDIRGTWKIYNQKQQNIGYLSATISSRIALALLEGIKAPEDNQTKMLRIRSIVANFSEANFNKAYVKVVIGKKIGRSQIVRSRKRQIVVINEIQVEKQSNQTSGKLEFYGLDEQQNFLGEAKLDLSSSTLQKNIPIKNRDKEIGLVLIDGKLFPKKHKRQNIRDNVSFDQSANYSQLDDDELTKSWIMRISKRQLSNVHRNRNIPFTKQERFKDYGDRANNNVSYLEEKNLSFKGPNEKGYYRGAAIGYGSRADIVAKKDNPGVGRYKLPCIWDRY